MLAQSHFEKHSNLMRNILLLSMMNDFTEKQLVSNQTPKLVHQKSTQQQTSFCHKQRIPEKSALPSTLIFPSTSGYCAKQSSSQANLNEPDYHILKALEKISISESKISNSNKAPTLGSNYDRHQHAKLPHQNKVQNPRYQKKSSNFISSKQPSSSSSKYSRPLNNKLFPEVCSFCKNNGEPPHFYKTHRLKDSANLVTCPILMKHQCELCGATGSQAHTKSYCPLAVVARTVFAEDPVARSHYVNFTETRSRRNSQNSLD